MNKEDIDALEDAAKKATPGPWVINDSDYIDAACHYEVCQVTANHPECEEQQAHNREYIAAANPAVVLALINKVRELEQKNLRLSSISAENYNNLTGWMDACLKAEDERDKLLPDANRYRWLRQQNWNGSPLCVVYNPAEAVKLGHTCPSGALLDAVIDERLKEDE